MSVSAKDLISGDRRNLAKAITLIESQSPKHQEQAQQLLEEILPKTGNSLRIGISGVPGVGKSTFIEALGMKLLEKGHKVAVLAVDPSSPISGGSVLGDKTRMEKLANSENAFVRPSPTSGSLGGVAYKTREALLLCEAAGFDVTLIETVGVGQSEYQVQSMVDFFTVLMLPNAGDEVQGIKRGILEMADLLVINKCDGDQVAAAEQAKTRYQSALDLFSQRHFWKPQVLTSSATEGTGIEEYWQQTENFFKDAKARGHIETQRREQNRKWFHDLLGQMLERLVDKNGKHYKAALSAVDGLKTSPFLAAKHVISETLNL